MILLRTWFVCIIAVTIPLAGLAAVADAQTQPLLPAPHQRNLELKQLMLEWINEARAEAGVTLVELGTNNAAQLQAEALFYAGGLSHWGPDGTKPYMRYSLAGGYGDSAENGSGFDFRRSYPLVRYAELSADATQHWREGLRSLMDSLMESPGHRANIIRDGHTHVNLGIAGSMRGLHFVIQDFEKQMLPLSQAPTITSEDRLIIVDREDRGRVFEISLQWHQPLVPLSRAQRAATFSYAPLDLPVATIRNPAFLYGDCGGSVFTAYQNPYDVPRDVSDEEALRLRDAAYQAFYETPDDELWEWVDAPCVRPEIWKVSAAGLQIEADLSDVLAQHGPGIYTIAIHIDADVYSRISHTIFHDTPAPGPYLHHEWFGTEAPVAYQGEPTAASVLWAELNAVTDVAAAVFIQSTDRWLGYAEINGTPAPGAVNAAIHPGDIIWVVPAP